MTENTFKLIEESYKTGRPIQANHEHNNLGWKDCSDPSFLAMDEHPGDYRVKPAEPLKPYPDCYRKLLAVQVMIDDALKALGQESLLKRVEELECLVSDCMEELTECRVDNDSEALIARCKEALK